MGKDVGELEQGDSVLQSSDKMNCCSAVIELGSALMVAPSANREVRASCFEEGRIWHKIVYRS